MSTFNDPAASAASTDAPPARRPLLTVSEARELLHVQAGDYGLDAKLQTYIAAADTRVATEMRPYADASPPLPGTRTWDAAKDAARFCFLSMWYRDHSQVELARAHREEFTAALKALRTAARADKPPRTQAVLASPSESLSDRRVYEPAAADQYLAREFI